jgi:hypothetical protein
MKSTEPVNSGTPEYRKKKDSALLESLRVNLVDFFNEMVEERWFAKERELVSRFTFTKLIGMSGCCESFFSPAQISIETRVKQVTEAGKNEAAKDMIIWKDINQTAWSQDSVPLLIVEWKYNETTPFQSDISCLKLYTS